MDYNERRAFSVVVNGLSLRYMLFAALQKVPADVVFSVMNYSQRHIFAMIANGLSERYTLRYPIEQE